MIKTNKVNILFKNRYFQVENNQVEFNGKTNGEHLKIIPASFEGVAVLPIMENGMVMIQDEYRYAYNGFITQVVKGGLKKGQTPEDAVKEELEEELSLSFGELIYVGKFVEHPSIVKQRGHAYIALGCKNKKESLSAEATECFGNKRLASFDDLLKSVMNNEIECSVTQMIVLKAAFLLKN